MHKSSNINLSWTTNITWNLILHITGLMGYSCLWPSPSVDQMKTFKVPKHLQVFSWGQHCIFLQSLLFAYTLTQISSISDPLLGESGFILSMNCKLSEQEKRWKATVDPVSPRKPLPLYSVEALLAEALIFWDVLEAYGVTSSLNKSTRGS